MIVQLTTQRGIPVCKAVASYAEASAAVLAFIGGRGASQCPPGMGLIAANGQIVAHVSYNGRVWPAREWEAGMAPLFDPT